MTGPEQQRHAARGVCFWYQSVSSAKAQASCRYRIGNLIEHLMGAEAVVAERLPRQLEERIRTLCCIRPQLQPNVTSTLDRLRARGVELVADFDDLLFAGEVSGLPAEKSRHLQAYAETLGFFHRYTVSTRALAKKLEALAPNATVALVPNGLSASWVAQGKALYPSWQPGDPLVIRYFAGSPSHDADVASIAPVLAGFLGAHSAARLEIVGPVTIDTTVLPQDRVTLVPAVAHDELPKLLASSWVNLAPLQPSEYGESKSAIKFLEASAFACPTLASPNDDLMRHSERGAPLIACHSAEDWYEGLTSLLDTDQRVALGQAAAAYVAAHGMAAESAKAWVRAASVEAA